MKKRVIFLLFSVVCTSIIYAEDNKHPECQGGVYLEGNVISSPYFVHGKDRKGVELSHTKFHANVNGNDYEVSVDNIFAEGYSEDDVPKSLKDNITKGASVELCGETYQNGAQKGIHWVHLICPSSNAVNGFLIANGKNLTDVDKYCYIFSHLKGSNENKLPRYISANLTDKSKKIFEKEIGELHFSNSTLRPNQYLDHTTIAFAPDEEIFNEYKHIVPENSQVTIEPYLRCWSDSFKVEAARVNLYDQNGNKFSSTNNFDHITLSTDGKSPVASNDLFLKSENDYKGDDKITDLNCEPIINTSLDAVSKYNYE